jgi:hypothetical protein
MTPSETMLGPQLDRIQRLSLIVGIVGVVLCIVGVFVDSHQFLRAYLYAYLFWTGMTIGSLALLMINHVVGGKWGVVIRRLVESGTRNFPLMLVLLAPVLIGMTSLYIWAMPGAAHDPVIQSKRIYLNTPFFIFRLFFYFAVWILYSWILRRKSLEQDRTGDPGIPVRMRQISAPGLVVLTLSATFAFFDLIMSLEPHWFSTIYGAMFLIGQILETIAFTIAILYLLSKHQPFREILTTQHFHDLGNLMLAFTILWAYLSFSQFIIIWSGNLPEEIPWYIRRFTGGWGAIAILLVVFHFFVPFLILLQRFVKQNPNILKSVAIGMIAIRLLDVFWIVEPAFYQSHFPHLHSQVFTLNWQDFVTPVAIGGIWIAAYIWHLKKVPLVPIRDPRLMGAPKKMVGGLI